MKTRHKLLALGALIALVLSLTAFFAFGTAAESTPTLDIGYCNLSFRDSVVIKYAVYTENVASPSASVKLLVWTEPQSEYILGTQDSTLTTVGTQTISGKEHVVFDYDKLTAKQMTDVIYTRAYAEIDGEVYYSDVNKYSILQYAYNKLGKTDDATANTEMVEMLNAMLAYGAAAQKYFDYKLDNLATDEYYQIKVEGGTLSDGSDNGLFKAGAEVSLTAPKQNANGCAFIKWSDSEGNEIASTATANITVETSNETYTAVYETVKYSEGLEFTSNGDGTCYVSGIGDCTDTDIIVPTTSPDNDTVTGIGASAFEGCASITSIKVPDSVTSIGSFAFNDCSNLKDVYVTDLEAWLNISFGNNTARPNYYGKLHILDANGKEMLEITIPDTFTKIPGLAFKNCTATKIIIPGSVTSIGNSAFFSCSSLTSVTIPGSVTSIGNYAFFSCSSLTSITIPDSITSIGTQAFNGCSSLTSITIPDSITSIGTQAFSGCYRLVEVINKSDLNITAGTSNNGYVASYAIEVHKGDSKIINKDGYLFYTYNSINYLFGYAGTDTELALPSDYNGEKYEIYDYAFRGCSSLTSVTIPNSVTSIGSLAFSGCRKLVEVINKSDLNITAGSSDNGKVAYYAIEVHNGESKIVNKDGYLFYTYNSVNYLLGYVDTDTELTLPSDYNGEKYEIYDYAFSGCSSLTSITIPDSVTTIGGYAFENCTSLTSITIPNNVTCISFGAFKGCSYLTSITIPFIGESAIETFDNHFGYIFGVITSSDNESGVPSSLKKVIINNGVTSICQQAFYYCSSLTSITIPNSVTSIGESAFYNCSSLTSINFNGTIDQWNAISKESGWNNNTGDYVIHCTDGDISK